MSGPGWDPITQALLANNPFNNPLNPGVAQQAAQNAATSPIAQTMTDSGVPPASAGTQLAAALQAIWGTHDFSKMDAIQSLPGGGEYAPFGAAGVSGAKGPPAWMAKLVLQAYKDGNTKYMQHLLSDPGIAGNPHLANFIKGVFAGNADKIAEANYYATNPSYNGWNNAAGDGIPGDGM